LIVPGFKLMQEALERRTALLPYVELCRPIELIGRDTKSSIRAGLVYGVVALCDGILARLMAKKCHGYTVVATGGDSGLLRPLSRYLRRFDEDLIPKGLALVADHHEFKKSS
jgi:type III pantothenate kinase